MKITGLVRAYCRFQVRDEIETYGESYQKRWRRLWAGSREGSLTVFVQGLHPSAVPVQTKPRISVVSLRPSSTIIIDMCRSNAMDERALSTGGIKTVDFYSS